jgi:hypothetical protein
VALISTQCPRCHHRFAVPNIGHQRPGGPDKRSLQDRTSGSEVLTRALHGVDLLEWRLRRFRKAREQQA